METIVFGWFFFFGLRISHIVDGYFENVAEQFVLLDFLYSTAVLQSSSLEGISYLIPGPK